MHSSVSVNSSMLFNESDRYLDTQVAASMGQRMPVEGNSSSLGVEAQVDTLRISQIMVQHLQNGTVDAQAWQGLTLMLLLQLKRKCERVGIEACINESVFRLLLRVLSKALPDTALMLGAMKQQTQTAMLRPPSCLLETIDEQIFSSFPAAAGDVLHGAAPSPEGMWVLQRLSTAVVNGALTHVISLNESAQASEGSKSQSRGMDPPHAFQDSFQSDRTQTDSTSYSAHLEDGAAEEPPFPQMLHSQQKPQKKQQQQPRQEPPPQWPPGPFPRTQPWDQQEQGSVKQFVDQQLSQRHWEWQQKKTTILGWDERNSGAGQSSQSQLSTCPPVDDTWSNPGKTCHTPWDMARVVHDVPGSSNSSNLVDHTWDSFGTKLTSKVTEWTTAVASPDMHVDKFVSSRMTESTGRASSDHSKTTASTSHAPHLKYLSGHDPRHSKDILGWSCQR
jgi:hypothetical protein